MEITKTDKITVVVDTSKEPYLRITNPDGTTSTKTLEMKDLVEMIADLQKLIADLQIRITKLEIKPIL